MLRQNLISIIIMSILVIALLASISLFFMVLAKKSNIEAEICSKCEAIKMFVSKSKMPLTEEALLSLKEEQNKLKNIYSRFALVFESPLGDEIPAEELEPLKFKERLVQTQKKIRENAKRRNLLLPESLGFTKYETELSKPSDIKDLIMRLKVLEEVTHLMALSGIGSLDEITFANKSAEENFYYDIPVSFKMGCMTSRLIDFLYKLRTSAFIFIVDDLDITNVQTGSGKEEAHNSRVTASLAIKAIALK